MTNSASARGITALFLFSAGTAIILSAWLADDAMITLRQVDMFVDGAGIVWNPGFRVQAFTHPAWFWLLSAGHALTGSLFYMTIAISGVCSLAALLLYALHCRERLENPVTTGAFMFLPLASAAFIDYTASGLENSLSFLLVAAVFRLLSGEEGAWRDRALWTLLALAVLTRQDHALQFGPLALWYLVSRGPSAQLRRMVPGVLVMLGWFGFATFYFGFPLPNTFFAKLSTGLDDAQIATMAGYFWRASVEENLFTLSVIAIGILAAIPGRGTDRALAFGVILHLAYLHRIGGDFMQGRMLTVDFFIACFLAVRWGPYLGRVGGRVAFAAVFALVALRLTGLAIPPAAMEPRTVSDERRFYYPVFGMLSPYRNWPETRQPPAVERGHVMMLCGFAGSTRIAAPDSVHIVDQCGLAEPFLAHVPVVDTANPRPGHYVRAVPMPYPEALETGRAPWMPGGGARFFHDIHLIATAPLMDAERLRAILRVNLRPTGIDAVPWRYPEKAQVPMSVGPCWLTDLPDRPDVASMPALRGADVAAGSVAGRSGCDLGAPAPVAARPVRGSDLP